MFIYFAIAIVHITLARVKALSRTGMLCCFLKSSQDLNVTAAEMNEM